MLKNNVKKILKIGTTTILSLLTFSTVNAYAYSSMTDGVFQPGTSKLKTGIVDAINNQNYNFPEDNTRNVYCAQHVTMVYNSYDNYHPSSLSGSSTNDNGSGARSQTRGYYVYTPTYSGSPTTVSNNALAYMISAYPNTGFKNFAGSHGGAQNCVTSVSDTAGDGSHNRLKQEGLWCDESYNSACNGTKLGGDASGYTLYNEALDFERFYNTYATNYRSHVSISNGAQTIALQDSKQYIFGPFSISYPDQPKFSVMNGLYVKTSSGKKVNIPTSNILQNGSTGYPKSGSPFYIRVNANDLGNETKLTVGAHFVYMAGCSATYDKLYGSSLAYSYNCSTNGYIHEYDTTRTLKDKEGKEYTVTDHNYDAVSYPTETRQDAQDIAIMAKDKVSRTYKECTVEKGIDIGMKMGGRVWKDAKTNDKDSGINGIFDKNPTSGTLDYRDELIPNVTVTLYKQNENTPYHQDGMTANPTVTDNSGNYIFKGICPMYKYYVKFTYNGQYYQPTKYLVGGNANWSVNSKGLDRRSERSEFNNIFAEIGSSPCNYGKNRTFSELYLQGYRLQDNGQYVQSGPQIIDKFGNLIKTSGSNDEEKAMIKYATDCRMNAYTCNQSGSLVYYPIENRFVVDTYQHTILVSSVPKVKAIYNKDDSYPSTLRIDLGITPREKSDLALRKEIFKATTTINGRSQQYNYKKRELKKDSDGNEYWDISARLSDAKYYNTTYTREVYKEDYNRDRLDGNHDANLNVYVTYKINIRNQSGTINTKLMELVDYYDAKGYTLMGADSDYSPYVGDINGNKKNGYTINVSNKSRYAGTEKYINGYNNAYITFGKSNDLPINADMFVYLTFKVNKEYGDYGTLLLDDKDVGKENITEINGYRTYYSDKCTAPNGEYRQGDVAGLVDVDSNPGNVDASIVTKNGKVDYKKFEDDTDKAPNIKILLYNESRKLAGVAWKDERTQSSSFAQVGNGIREDKEKKIPGVTVKLWDADKNRLAEIYSRENDTWQDAITKTDADGKYLFEGYVPGNYFVKFTYGDTEETKKYNGQDFKTTTYKTQNGFDINNPDNLDNYNLLQADKDTTNKTYNSDARDLMSNKVEDKDGLRSVVDNYCNNDGRGNVTNKLATELWNAQNQLDAKLAMSAKSGKINAEIEYDRTISNVNNNKNGNVVGGSYDTTDKQNNTENYNKAGKYLIGDLDLGLEQRPKAQLKTTKQVVNVKVTLANGNALFDASQKATNVLWVNHKAHGTDTLNTYLDKDGYKSGKFDKNLMKDPVVRQGAANKGKIQLTMDEELMHGATIKATYAIFVANVGEADYKENQFYYLGTVGDENHLVKTNVNSIIDYVGYQATSDAKATRNNLKFDKAENDGWDTISNDDLNSLDANVKNATKTYNTVITNNLNNKALKPIIADQNSAKTIKNILDGKTDGKLPIDAIDAAQNHTDSIAAAKLVLSQVLSSENNSDDMTYNNMAEIIKTSNDVGRRMAASIVGNQDPLAEPTEVDADDAQEITILPPFGQQYIYYLLGAGVAIIIVAGVIIIKKKVLKK